MNFKKMASNIGLDVEEFTELAELFVTISLSDLKKLERGFDVKNTDQVASAAHSIKGAAGNLGFMEISSKAAQIESDARQGSMYGIEDRVKNIRKGLDAIDAELGE